MAAAEFDLELGLGPKPEPVARLIAGSDRRIGQDSNTDSNRSAPPPVTSNTFQIDAAADHFSRNDLAPGRLFCGRGKRPSRG